MKKFLMYLIVLSTITPLAANTDKKKDAFLLWMEEKSQTISSKIQTPLQTIQQVASSTDAAKIKEYAINNADTAASILGFQVFYAGFIVWQHSIEAQIAKAKLAEISTHQQSTYSSFMQSKLPTNRIIRTLQKSTAATLIMGGFATAAIAHELPSIITTIMKSPSATNSRTTENTTASK